MRKALIGILVGALAVGAAYYLGQEGQENLTETALPSSLSEVWRLPAVANAMNDNVESDFKLDADRLFDLSYQTDPALVAFAEANNLSVECIVAASKSKLHGIELPEGVCARPAQPESVAGYLLQPGEYADECEFINGDEVCHRVKISDHPYEQYSNSELESLATVSPEAAVILARRLQDNSESEKYYERAVVLSGKPGPLSEWMMHRNIGGLSRRNGVLDIPKAELGYEIYLTMEALGYPAGSSDEFAQALKEEGIDLTTVRERANSRITRLTKEREVVLGIGSRI